MAKPKKSRQSVPATASQAKVAEDDMKIPFLGLIRFFLGNKKRFSVTTLCGIIISVSVAWPIVKSWGNSTRNVAENILTLNAQGEIEKVKNKQENIEMAHVLMVQNIGHIRESQANLQKQQHQMWSDVRALRGMKAPPTPQPIPTFVPVPTSNNSDGP